jgi:hypothetical protein
MELKMARETAAQRKERLATERAQERAVAQLKQGAEYPELLMKTLSRCRYAGFVLEVESGTFCVRTNREVFKLTYAYTEDSQSNLEELVWELDKLDEKRAEEQRLAGVKAEALRKAQTLFNPEERKLLGL